MVVCQDAKGLDDVVYGNDGPRPSNTSAAVKDDLSIGVVLLEHFFLA